MSEESIKVITSLRNKGGENLGESESKQKLKQCFCKWRDNPSFYVGYFTSRLNNTDIVIFVRECETCHDYRIVTKEDNKTNN